MFNIIRHRKKKETQYRKNNENVVKNYKGMTQLNTIHKVFERIIQNKYDIINHTEGIRIYGTQMENENILWDK